jgi:CRP/FNR family cyclic AMP-dependent transcriptional regulator
MKRLDPIDPGKALGILNKVSFFNAFSSEEKEVLTGFHSHFFVAKPSTRIIAQGGQDQSFYIILSGQVAVHHTASPEPLAELFPGDFFGEISFLTDRKRTTSVDAKVTTILFEIDKATLKHMTSPIREKLKDNIIKVLVERLDHMNQRVIELSTPQRTKTGNKVN